MAIFGPNSSATYNGGNGNDTYRVDPSILVSVRINDSGGSGDLLSIRDTRPISFDGVYVDAGRLVFSNVNGSGDILVGMSGGNSVVETLNLTTVVPGGGGATSVNYRIITDLTAITGTLFLAAGTTGADIMVAQLTGGGVGGGSGVMYGGAGNDRMEGATDQQIVMYGGSGNDRIIGHGSQADLFFGGSGNDSMSGSGGADQLFGRSGNDRIAGGSGNDRIESGTGNDRLAGEDGADQLFGSTGNDRITGGNGGDRIDGGKGNDLMFGNSGADIFLFNVTAGDEGNDQILDFTIGVDKIHLVDYAGGSSVAQIASSNNLPTGTAIITLTETGTQITLAGVTFAQAQADFGAIFQIV